MAEETKPAKRRKPLFLRRDWYKKIKFGKGVKKKQNKQKKQKKQKLKK